MQDDLAALRGELLRRVDAFVVYYGERPLDAVGRVAAAIIDGDAVSSEDVQQLTRQGTLALAYLSIGEDREWRPGASWYLRDEEGQPLREARWDTYRVEVGDQTWRRHMLLELERRRGQGFAGIFIDTVDVAMRSGRPMGAIELIASLRDCWPDAPFVMNRGFDALDAARGNIDGVLFESFTARQEGDAFVPWSGEDLAWTELAASRLRAAGLPVWTLDYAPIGSDLAARCLQRARNWGFVPAVAEDLTRYRATGS